MLGIETSCDETAAAVLDAGRPRAGRGGAEPGREHAPYGGVVPEIAARAHLAHLPELVRDVMARGRDRTFAQLGGVAATAGPGLIGGLIVGSQFAKGIALAHGAALRRGQPPGGARADRAPARPGRPDGLAFPYLLLLVSGGHCQCVAVEGVGRHGGSAARSTTRSARRSTRWRKLLGLGWPGGPALERLAAERRCARASRFPARCSAGPGCDFSFSGLKTAVAHDVARHGAAPCRARAADLAAGFQAAVADVLADRARTRWRCSPRRMRGALLVVAGGVAANAALRAALAQAADAHGLPPARPADAALCATTP